jgi:hypothetical protein
MQGVILQHLDHFGESDKLILCLEIKEKIQLWIL